MVTWVLARRDHPLTAIERDAVLSAIRFFDGERCVIGGAVVMDDHVHVLVTPKPGFTLSKLLHSWKSFSAHELVKGGRPTPVREDESLDTIVRNGLHLSRVIEYIRANPRKKRPDIRDYPWLYLPD